jgi:hypothetical protein
MVTRERFRVKEGLQNMKGKEGMVKLLTKTSSSISSDYKESCLIF